MEPAPFYSDIALAPQRTSAHWIEARDGVRLRIGICPVENAKGLVQIFPGRTEYVEKYGRIMGLLAERGYSSAAIDWRGQGLAGRMLDDPLIGHVDTFPDYQLDVAAYGAALHALPEPRFLLAHSMGGAIGLRALLEGMDVKAAAFTAPMWGIKMPPYQDTISRIAIQVFRAIGQDKIRAPGTALHSYLLEHSFAGNTLTSDLDEWAYMKAQIDAVPEFALAGPSINWVREAIVDCAWMMKQTPPDIPTVVALGSDENIVPKKPIQDRMATWPGAELVHVPQARHEILMEMPRKRDLALDQILALFDQATG